MNLKPVCALIALSLSACATHSARDASPSIEVDALVRNVEQQLPNRTLPNGKQYCAEDATTEGEQDDCLGELEALNLLRVGDRDRALEQLRRGANRIKGQRMECAWVDVRCWRERAALRDGRAKP